jgi:hypothetical protein
VSTRHVLQPLKFSEQNLKHTPRNEKTKLHVNSVICGFVMVDTIYVGFVFFVSDLVLKKLETCKHTYYEHSQLCSDF